MSDTTKNSDRKPLLPLYAIISEQFFLREQAVERLKTRLAAEGDFNFNYDQFDAAIADIDAVLGAANTLPFACAYRLVLVNNIHQAKKEVLDTLETYAQSPSPTTVLAVVGEKLPKTSKLYKQIAQIGGIVERTAPKRKELPAIVQSLFAARGKEASLAIGGALVESVGENLEALDTAVIKTATYMGQRTTVAREDVDAVVETSAEVKVWDFANALTDRKAAEALSLFNLLLQQGNSIYPIQTIALRSVRELIIARACIESGDDSLGHLASVLGKPDWLIRRILSGARKSTSEHLRDGLGKLAQVEFILKPSPEGEAALQRWILEFCG